MMNKEQLKTVWEKIDNGLVGIEKSSLKELKSYNERLHYAKHELMNLKEKEDI